MDVKSSLLGKKNRQESKDPTPDSTPFLPNSIRWRSVLGELLQYFGDAASGLRKVVNNQTRSLQQRRSEELSLVLLPQPPEENWRLTST
ncbi:hypothetical protein CDAR_450591 [Caerostris darwini]|uniref:Uncharacterized protein n=1 Tax=Caerostris darwini TaxID=1538125 RepID=A0AAV4P7Z6_9ARAC|nr:hypothetical protein CDAR_450591 [Caerostris darwini]